MCCFRIGVIVQFLGTVHLRWSSRYSEDASTAKKCSPTRRQLRPRVSSAVFPSSPSYFYARTSAECESPRMIRHAHSHNDFSPESIPLCQVNQPRSNGSRKIISITVSNVNEKEKSKNSEESKVSEPQKNVGDDEITDLNDSEFFRKDKLVNCPCLDREDSSKSHFFYLQNIYQNRGLEERKVSENLKGNRHEPLEGSKDEPFTESEHPQLHRASKTSCQQSESSQENEKPKRYNRSSLKKQKLRLQEDSDCYLNVPIYEFESNTFDKNENVKTRKLQNPKSAEMRRKAFLRKISLQDTYVNYNQDYWLDYKKSLRFHKSIDLGYLRNDEKARAETGGETKTPDDQQQSFPKDFKEQTTESIGRPRSSAVTRQSKPTLKVTSEGSLKKSDSDPVIFPSICSCADCQGEQSPTDEFPTDSTVRNKKGDMSCPKSFFLPSNDDVPLFLERNGLIETDFDILDDVPDEGCFGNSASEHPEDTESSESEARPFEIVPDFSNFYEIKLNTSTESDSEKLNKPNAFDFQGGQAFFGTLPSTSEESDVFYNETDPLMVSDATRPKLPNFSSSSSPPESNPDYN